MSDRYDEENHDFTGQACKVIGCHIVVPPRPPMKNKGLCTYHYASPEQVGLLKDEIAAKNHNISLLRDRVLSLEKHITNIMYREGGS